MVNEPLRALLRMRLREADVAARLGVDPKTVRRWLNGRLPYPHNRAAIAELVGVDEADLWPDAGGLLAARTRPEELGMVYPHRWAVPREVWMRLFGSAEHEIAILAYSALFLAEDAGILQILVEKVRAGVTVRIALGIPTGLTLCCAAKKKASATPWRPRSGMRSRCTGRSARCRTSRSASITPCCTTRSTAPTTRCSSISTPTASPPRRPSCSASAIPVARWPSYTLTASNAYGLALRRSHTIADERKTAQHRGRRFRTSVTYRLTRICAADR